MRPSTKLKLLVFYALFMLAPQIVNYGAGLLDVRIVDPYLFALLALLIIMIAASATFLARKKKLSAHGISLPTKETLLDCFFFIFLLMPLAFIGRLIDPGYDLWYAQGTGLYAAAGLMSFILILPLYVIKEEIFERTIFQESLASYGFYILAALISINFAIAHFFIPEQGIVHVITWAISVLFGSFILVLFYHMTRNLLASILLHLLFNVLICIQIYLHITNGALEAVFWAIMLAGAALSIIALRGKLSHTLKIAWAAQKKVILSKGDMIFFLLFALVHPILLLLSLEAFAIGFVVSIFLVFIP